MEQSIDFRLQSRQSDLAWVDIKEGLTHWRIWLLLAYQDIKLRYRRSILGPFWITLSMAITVYSMGFLYGHLFRTDLNQYYPFLVAGMLAWAFISTVITEQTEAFIGAENYIKQIKLPYTLYIHRIVTKNIIIFFHNILVMLPIYFIFHESIKINFYTLLLIPGFLVLYFNAMTYGLILAMTCARYRDVSQLVKSLIQIVFFLTPVMWSPAVLPPNKQFLISLNPFYSFLELIRAPLLGVAPTFFHLAIVLGATILGAFFAMRLFVPHRSRIVYWL
ncbi:MAG: ABC transporter [Gammaproteobacteria bacterium RIFCSPHIGHO2_12_FULL_42_10]|nr:MAG: ABC transporter [Gammaproteobacteria bacterium RIFCSPHIGHO2_12_FULL_42_10]